MPLDSTNPNRRAPLVRAIRAEKLRRDREERGQQPLKAFDPIELPEDWEGFDANGEACNLGTRFTVVARFGKRGNRIA